MKRCRRNPVNRGTLCKRAARLRRYVDRRIRELEHEIADRDYLIRTLMLTMEVGRAAPLDEEFRKMFPKMPKYALPSAKRLLDSVVQEREDLIVELREMRSLRNDTATCGDCRGRGRRFPKDRREVHLVQCARCHGQGYYPARLGF